MPTKTLQIRNSTAEFLIFTKQTGENGINPKENENIWQAASTPSAQRFQHR